MKFHHIPDLPLFAFIPEPGGRMKLFKGGGGSSGGEKYENLEGLYQEQAESAKMLREMAAQNLPGATRSYMDKVNTALDPGYVEKQVGNIQTDLVAANAREQESVNRNLASMGVNPNDPRYAKTLHANNVNNAAKVAAGKNIARQEAQNYQLNVAKDAVGTFTGQSNNAANQTANAAGGLASLYSQQNNTDAQNRALQQNAVGNAVGGGMALMSMFKDGGKVKGLGMPKRAKRLEVHAGGGMVGSQQGGFLNTPAVTPPPTAGAAPAPQQNALSKLGGLGSMGKGLGLGKQGALGERFMASMKDKGASIMEKTGDFFGSGEVSAYGKGMRLDPEQATAAKDAYLAAADKAREGYNFADAATYQSMGEHIGAGAGLEAGVATDAVAGAATATEAAGTVAGAAETAGAVTGAAEAAGGVSALTSGLGVAAAALPWVGAAAAVGSLLDLFADGGKVEGKAVDLRDGDKVPGKWKENRDIVPALLVEEEGVLNAEAMALIGDGAFNKLNGMGLMLRKGGYTPKEIKGFGLGRLGKKKETLQ